MISLSLTEKLKRTTEQKLYGHTKSFDQIERDMENNIV